VFSSRRFPPPWSVEETEPCFIRDHTAQALACVYFEEETGSRWHRGENRRRVTLAG
jgi:hypothetical protein